MILKYRKKPVVIETIQYTGGNLDDCAHFCDDLDLNGGTDKVIIKTLEGVHICSIGDYIIKGVNGEFYPCKPDIFHKTYELVTTV